MGLPEAFRSAGEASLNMGIITIDESISNREIELEKNICNYVLGPKAEKYIEEFTASFIVQLTHLGKSSLRPRLSTEKMKSDNAND